MLRVDMQIDAWALLISEESKIYRGRASDSSALLCRLPRRSLLPRRQPRRYELRDRLFA